MQQAISYEAITHRHTPLGGQESVAQTGTVAALLANNGVLWTLRYPADAPKGTVLAVYRVQTTTINVVAFSANAFGRGLGLRRYVPTNDVPAADPSGGNAFSPVLASSDGPDTLAVGHVAGTAALTVTGYTASANIVKHVMSTFTAAASLANNNFNFALERAPIYLKPGQMLGLAATQDMDTGGTFELTVHAAAAMVRL